MPRKRSFSILSFLQISLQPTQSSSSLAIGHIVQASARDYNCRSSLPFQTPSRGLRCPRNQPLFLWEILQQSLAAHKHKVSPWTKAHHLTWSPSRTMTGMSWPPPNVESSSHFAHQKPPQIPLNLSALDFFISQNGNRRKGQLTPVPSFGSISALPRGLNLSQTDQHDNLSQDLQSTRLFSHPIYLHYNYPLLNNSQQNNANSLNISSSRSPMSTNIPKNYSGHHRNHDTVSILMERENIPETDIYPALPFSDNIRHHHNDSLLRRTKHRNKSIDKWPLRPPPPPHSDSVSRQSYIYPTSLTSTTNDSNNPL